MTIKITTDVTGVLCAKEGWEEKNGTVIRRECGQTLGRVRVRTVVIISLQRTKG